jgi:hypothetical protein
MKVADMNTAFGNARGNFYQLDIPRLKRQSFNIGHEYVELLSKGFGLKSYAANYLTETLNNVLLDPANWSDDIDVSELRDALCDIQVFAMGAQHFMGVNGEDDMAAVVTGVLTRFIKDEADKAATIAKHAAKGVTDVYFEGEFPRMVMKSASDQPDAPKGKFLKSASFKETVFPAIHPTPGEAFQARVLH